MLPLENNMDHILCHLQRTNARVIADSILNLRAKKLISAPNEDPHIVEQLRVEGITLEDQGVGGVNEE